MTGMSDTEARTIIEKMFDTAISDISSFQIRIEKLEADFEQDPWEDTAAQIKLVKARLERRQREAAALAVAEQRFERTAATRETHDIGAAWQFIHESYEDSGHSPSRRDWSDEDIFGFVADNHVDGLDAFKKEGN